MNKNWEDENRIERALEEAAFAPRLGAETKSLGRIAWYVEWLHEGETRRDWFDSQEKAFEFLLEKSIQYYKMS